MSLRACTAALLLFTFTVGLADLAAHLAVVRTSPANAATLAEPPPRVQVWFNQQPAPRISRLEMTGPSGEIALGELVVDAKERSISATVPATLPAGRYEVAWRTAGDDGHVQRGAFSFSVRASE